jgi:hypothetical protein
MQANTLLKKINARIENLLILEKDADCFFEFFMIAVFCKNFDL